MNFEAQLVFGKTAESAIAKWLMRRGNSVLPVYEKIIDEGKGPQLFTGGEGLIAPDILTIKNGKVFWIEAKHKSAFTWYRKKQVFETGIDRRHYLDYLRVAETTTLQIWLLFLHRGGQAKDSSPSPAGLFGNNLLILKNNISHESDLYGPSGMIYWTRTEDGGPLRLLASLEEVEGRPEKESTR